MSHFDRSHAVILGVDRYVNGIPPLRTAVNDAGAVASLLREKHSYEVQLYLNEEVTRANVQRLIREDLPSQVGEGDRLVFYFAGHGIAKDGDDGPVGLLLPQDAALDDTDTFLKMTELHDALIELRCRHFLCVFDCCFAGAFRWSATRNFQLLPEIIHRERFDRFVRDRAWQVITSAAHDQEALDALPGEALGTRDGLNGEHSPFTQALLAALEGEADIMPPAKNGRPAGDGVITATELYVYLRDRVEPATEERRFRQTPGLWMLRKHDKGEFIFHVPGRKAELPPAPPLDEGNNPYRGFEPFTESQKSLFFRERVVEQLLSRVLNEPLTAVVGASRSGKSSLVAAGLLPRLRAPEMGCHVAALGAPGEDPLRMFEGLAVKLGLMTQPPTTAETWRADEKALAEVVAGWGAVNADEKRLLVGAWQGVNQRRRLVLFIDQFDQIYTLCRDEEQRQHFLRLLVAALSVHGERLRLVVTVSSELARALESSSLKPWWPGAHFEMPAMNRNGLREAIEGPAQARVLYFDQPALVEHIVEEAADAPGALPLLSYTLRHLYLSYVRRAASDRALTTADYDELGGLVGLHARRLDKLYEGFDAPGQATLKRVLMRMLKAEDDASVVSRAAYLGEFEYVTKEESIRARQVLDRLHEERLVVRAADAQGEPYVRLAHDALLDRTAWLGELKQADDLKLRGQLGRAVEDWLDSGRSAVHLWHTHPRLPTLEKELDAQGGRLNLSETEFLRASACRRDRNRRMTRAAVVGLAALTFMALAFFYWRVRGVDQATARNDFRLSHEAAESRQNPFMALLFASRAYGRSPRWDSEAELYATRALHLARRMPSRVANLPLEPGRGVYSRDGSQLLVVDSGGRITSWSTETGAPYATPLGGTSNHPLGRGPMPVASRDGEWMAAFSDDGSLAAALLEIGNGSDLYHLYVWRARTGETVLRIELPGSFADPVYLAFSGDARQVVLVTTIAGDRPGRQYQMHVCDVETGALLHPELPIATRVGPKFRLGRSASRPWTLVTSEPSAGKHPARVIDIRTGRPPIPEARALNHVGEVLSVEFSRDGERVITTSLDTDSQTSVLYVWEAETGRELSRMPLNGFQVEVLDVAPDGKSALLANHTNKMLRLWREGGDAPNFEEGMVHEVEAAGFTSDGRAIWTLKGNEFELREADGELPRATMSRFVFPPETLAYHLAADAQKISTLSRRGVAMRWPVQARVPAPPVEGVRLELGTAKALHNTEFTPDGERLAALSCAAEPCDYGAQKQLQVWDTRSGKPVWAAAQPVGMAQWLALSESGARVAANANVEEGTSKVLIGVWDTATGRALNASPIISDERIESMVFNADETRLVVATKDVNVSRSVLQFDVASGKPVEGSEFYPFRERQGNSGRSFLAFSRRGDYVAVSPSDVLDIDQFYLWDTRTGQQVAIISRPGDPSFARLALSILRHAMRVELVAGRGFKAALGAGSDVTAEVSGDGILIDGQPVNFNNLPAPNLANSLGRFTPDGRFFVLGERMFDKRNGLLISEEALPNNTRAYNFTPDGGKFLMLTNNGIISSQPVLPGSGRFAKWIARLGEALSGMRLDEHGQVVPLPQTDYSALRKDFFDELDQALRAEDERARFANYNLNHIER